MKKLIGILFLWSVLICSVHAEVIVLRSGKTIKGEILLNNDEVLILRQKDGSRFQFPKQEIISIDADAIQKSQSTTDTLVLNKVAFNLSVAGGATHTPNGWGGFVQPMLFIGANIAKNQPVFVGGSIGYNGVITRDNTYSWIPIQATLRCPIVRKKTGNNTMDGQGHKPERSAPFSTTTVSLSTADGSSLPSVYTKMRLSNFPGCPLGLYLALISAVSPGATNLLSTDAVRQEQEDTSLVTSRTLVPTLLKLNTKVLGASSSFIVSATRCFVSKLKADESEESCGSATLSILSLGIILN